MISTEPLGSTGFHASVLVPYKDSMMAQPEYASDFAALERVCQERGVALLEPTLAAAASFDGGDTPTGAAMQADASALAVEPLFECGVSDQI